MTAIDTIDFEGEPCYLSFMVDITERKAAERALHDSEARFAKLFHSGPVGVSLSGLADGRYLEVNDAYLAIVGYRREELVGHTSLELGVIAPEDRLRLVAELQGQGRVHGVDLVIHAKGGEQRHTLYAIEPMDIAGQSCVLSSVIDITARKRLEDELQASVEYNTPKQDDADSPPTVGIVYVKEEYVNI